MILLKANPKLKNVFSKLIRTMNVTVTWTDVFVIVNNNLILAGDVRSLIFSFDNKKIYTNILEIPIGSKNIDDMPNDSMLENVINMSLYAFGKWGSIGALRVDKDYKALNALFESVLRPAGIEPVFNSENFRFYKGGIQITYEDAILEVLKFLKNDGKLKEGQNLITAGKSTAKSDDNESRREDIDAPVDKERSRITEEDEDNAEIGLWHNLVWKKETCDFVKHSGNEDNSAFSRIGHDFYITDNLCPKCRQKLYMAMYPSGKELLIDTEEGRVFMARTYTCHNCNSFYTPRPKRLLQEGDVYSLKFGEDRTAYEDYLSILGENAERTANYKFNEFESERGGANGGSMFDSSYINELNSGSANGGADDGSAESGAVDVQKAWNKTHAERAQAIREEQELERLAQEEAARAQAQAEKERQALEEAARAQAEQERIASEQLRQAELEFEKAEQERLAKEAETQARLEQERQALEKAELERSELERLEYEKIERLQAEQKRRERERLEWEKAEQERLEREKEEYERRERERMERLQAERERLEREKLEWERADLERQEQARLERERLQQERLDRERIEREKLELERLKWEEEKQERLAKEKAEKERLERERLEQEKAEREKREQERIEREKAEKERIEREKIEREKAEKERAEREEAERIRKEQEKLAIRQEILLLSGKTTDELRLILKNLEHKNEARTEGNPETEEERSYLAAVKETLRTKLNAKYAARMGVLGNLSFKELTDLRNQIEGEEVLYPSERDEYLEKIDTYLNKAQAVILEQKIELSRNKTYAEIERIMDEVSKRNCPDDIKQDALNKLEQIRLERAAVEVEDLIAHIPLHLDRKQLAVYLEKIDKYEGVDLTPYSEQLEEKKNLAEIEEISAMMKRGGKKDRASLWNLYEELKARDYKEENKAPYLEKLYDKLREIDEEQIDKICPSITSLSFEEGQKVYAQIEEGMFLPEIKTDALEMVKRRLTKLKTDESSQLMRKLKQDIEENMTDCDSLYFYDARAELRKLQSQTEAAEDEELDEEDREAMMSAIDSYASPRDDYEYPLMVCDASRNHSGKDGFILTPDHIFYHSLLNSGRINISDITEIKANKGFFGKGIYVKYLGGNKEKLPNNITRDQWDAFVNALNDFINYIHEKPESRSLEYMAKEKHDVKCCYRCGHVYTEGDVCPKCGSKMNN
ncbi:MAG: hypothetical protein NC433_11475 [Clostridiales bacterium]|nr:hypothetical protein [Clostridiales bacterium]